jgi:hypothetical protein
MKNHIAPRKIRSGWLLGIILTGCLLLGISWTGLRRQAQKLSSEINVVKVQQRQVEAIVMAAKNSRVSAPIDPVLAEPDLSTLTPEQHRRTITLNLFDQLKRKHALSAPASRKNPPPAGPDGFFFPELAENAEYGRLQLAMIRNGLLWREKKSLQALGVAPETVEKALDLLAEAQMAVQDFNQLNKSGGMKGYSGRTYQSLTALREGFDQELRAVLGEEPFARYKEREDNASSSTNYLFNNLALRLSYSDSPLTNDRIEQLQALVTARSKTAETTQQSAQILPNGVVRRTSTVSFNPYTYTRSDEFLGKAQGVLNPEQIAALQQLRSEQEASQKRAKLPKSSELPRNAASSAPSKK